MRKQLVLVIAASVAFAASNASAGLYQVNASLDVVLGTLPPMQFTGGAPAASSDGVGGAATLPAGALSGMFQTAIIPPLLGIIEGIGVAAPGIVAGSFATQAEPAVNGALAFDGVSGTMSLEASAYLLNASGDVVFEIPLHVVGAGGTSMAHISSLVAVQVIGNPFQLGSVTLMGGFNGTVHTVTALGIDDRTPGGKGTLVLVSPVVVDMQPLGSLAAVATLTLEYVPEPGTLLLIGTGMALWLLARRRS